MIDPIPVAEELRRIAEETHRLHTRSRAGRALGWFSEFALSKMGGGPRSTVGGVLGQTCPIIASATPNVADAKIYLDKAFRQHERAIIEQAIKLAEADFKLPDDA